MTYDLTIYSKVGRVNFRALFYKKKDGKIYFRPLIDRFEYSKMIETFFERGAIDIEAQSKEDLPQYDIKHTTFDDILEVVKYLKKKGFNVKLQEVPRNFIKIK